LAPGLIKRWYLRYSLSLRDVEELLSERGLRADTTTIWRWVQRYGPELVHACAAISNQPTNPGVSMRLTFELGRWCYLYRAIDSTGAKIDFLLSALLDAGAAKRLFRKALVDPSHPEPRVINTDQAPLYGSAIRDIKKDGTPRRPLSAPTGAIPEQHPRTRPPRDQTTCENQAGLSRIPRGTPNDSGYEAMHMIRKGQARWVSGSDVRRIGARSTTWRIPAQGQTLAGQSDLRFRKRRGMN
jgi:IS6 family transposase